MNTPGIKPPPTSSTKPKPQAPKNTGSSASFNPFEMVRDEAKEAGKQVIEVPKQVMQDSVDQMWSAILGVEPPKARQEGEKPPDSFTKLNMERLNAAYARNDADAVASIQQQLSEHQQQKQENQAQHRKVQQDTEKAIYEMEMEEQERKKKQMEEEQQKRMEEEEERRAQQNSMSEAGAGKKKAGIGQARPKASTDNVFEQGRKKG